VEYQLVLQKVYEMSEAHFRQYWIGKVFRAELAAGPKIVNSTDAAIGLGRQHRDRSANCSGVSHSW